jgi:hypothetical protein
MAFRSIRTFVLITMALGAAPACKQGSSADPAAKPAAGDPVADKPAPAATDKPATKPAVIDTPPIAVKLGPIDVAATTIDLEALFPGTTYGYRLERRNQESDTIELRRGNQLLLQATLGGQPVNGVRIMKIVVSDASIPLPSGIKVGDSVDQLTSAMPGVECVRGKAEVTCTSPAAPALAFSLGDGTIKQITWSAPEGSTLAVVRRPYPAGDRMPDQENRKPTAEEVDRCARLLIAVEACEVAYDPEVGWYGVPKKAWKPAAAHKACDVPMLFKGNASAMPVHLLAADAQAKVEAGAQQGCAQLKAALDEVDPQDEPAGYEAGD